jgi:AcrR family transcriptional regulator
MSTKQAVLVPGRRRAPMAKSELTQGRILDAALRLFNERGTAAVSTNQIAAAAGLSTGNLYYHFADKHQVIRALHNRYAAAHEGLWDPGNDGQADIARLRANLAKSMELAWQYRFFERELLALLRADPELRADYCDVYQRRLGQWVSFGELLTANGVTRPPVPIADLAVAVWLIGQNWLPFLEITGDPRDPRQLAKGCDIVLAVLWPYLAGPTPTE